jgi:hypothetical protein
MSNHKLLNICHAQYQNVCSVEPLRHCHIGLYVGGTSIKLIWLKVGLGRVRSEVYVKLDKVLGKVLSTRHRYLRRVDRKWGVY